MPSLAQDMRMACDPGEIMRAAGREPDRWQADLMRTMAFDESVDTGWVLASRQAGKDETDAALGVWHTMYVPGSLVLAISPSLRQTQELYRRAQEMRHAASGGAKPMAESALRYELENRSRFISLPANEVTTRGYAKVSLVILNEAAMLPDAIITALRPTLAISGGKLLCSSTPKGARGFFHEAFRSRDRDAAYYTIPATEVPRLSKTFLAKEKRRLGKRLFEQEYLCRFLGGEEAVFDPADISRARDPDLHYRFGQIFFGGAA